MERRVFMAGVSGGLLGAPHAVGAQPTPRVHRIGLLTGTPPTAESRLWEGFFQGLREPGVRRGAEHPHRGPVVRGANRATPRHRGRVGSAQSGRHRRRGRTRARSGPARHVSDPLVLAYHPDPAGSGLVVSLARPGRNVTGLSLRSPDLVGKQLQLLKEAVPGVSRVAVLWNPGAPAEGHRLAMTAKGNPTGPFLRAPWRFVPLASPGVG